MSLSAPVYAFSVQPWAIMGTTFAWSPRSRDSSRPIAGTGAPGRCKRQRQQKNLITTTAAAVREVAASASTAAAGASNNSNCDSQATSWRSVLSRSASMLAGRRRGWSVTTRWSAGLDEPALPCPAAAAADAGDSLKKHATVRIPPSGGGDAMLEDAFEELDGDRPRYPCVVKNCLAAPPTPYDEAWEWQKKTLEQLASKADDLSEADVVLLTQHEAVFTLGTGSTLDNLKFAPAEAPFKVVRTERGGEVTYHGPGQIVMYPIMNLRRYRKDIHWYLRALEETVIRTLAKLGLRGERIEGLTGVWVGGYKVAAVGVRVKRWITMHGLSLNVRPDLEHFRHIIPCGIGNRPVGSLEQLCVDDEGISMERVGALLLESFEEVFRVHLAVALQEEKGVDNRSER